MRSFPRWLLGPFNMPPTFYECLAFLTQQSAQAQIVLSLAQSWNQDFCFSKKPCFHLVQKWYLETKLWA